MIKVVKNIARRLLYFYRRRIAKEQYPMLTVFSKWNWQRKGAMGVVFMLHHVIEKDPFGIPVNQDLKVSPTFLEHIIIKYNKNGFDFISLDELSDIFSSKCIPERPFVAFTLDDGYFDNYTHAFPIFKKYQVPFCIFLSTDFADKKAILWWDCIEDLIMSNDDIITSDGISYPCRTFEQKQLTFLNLRRRIQKLNQHQLEEELKCLFRNYDIDWLAPIKEKGMLWEQINEMANHPLCTIGGHTVSHPALNMLSDNSFRKEIREGVMKIEAATGKKVQHFAYPYGSPNIIGNREYRLIKDFSFKTTFCSSGGCILRSDMTSTTHLPRVFLNES